MVLVWIQYFIHNRLMTLGQRQTDFSDLQLRRLDPVKQQTTPRKIINNGKPSLLQMYLSVKVACILMK